jgi:hypothetical protein
MAKYVFSNVSKGVAFVAGTNEYPVEYSDIQVPGPSTQLFVPSNQSVTSLNPPLQIPANGNRLSITALRVGVIGLAGARQFRPDAGGSYVPQFQEFTVALVDSAGLLVPNTARLIRYHLLDTWTPISLLMSAPASAGVVRLVVLQNDLNQADPAGFGTFKFDSLNVQAIYVGALIARSIDLEINTVELLGA